MAEQKARLLRLLVLYAGSAGGTHLAGAAARATGVTTAQSSQPSSMATATRMISKQAEVIVPSGRNKVSVTFAPCRDFCTGGTSQRSTAESGDRKHWSEGVHVPPYPRGAAEAVLLRGEQHNTEKERTTAEPTGGDTDKPRTHMMHTRQVSTHHRGEGGGHLYRCSACTRRRTAGTSAVVRARAAHSASVMPVRWCVRGAIRWACLHCDGLVRLFGHYLPSLWSSACTDG